MANEIFEFAASFLDPLIQKAGRAVQGLSPTFTRRMLNAYFETEYNPINRAVDMFEENAL